MPVTIIFTGLACGTLLAAVGLTLWDGFWQVPGLSRAVRAIGWLAGAFLLIGVLFAWLRDHSLSALALSGAEGLALRLILMAALAAPPITHRRQDAPWSNVMLIMPALVLAGGGLLRFLEPVETEVGCLPVVPVELALLICGGLGARALGEALSEIATLLSPSEPGGLVGPSAAAYMLLTLLVGGTALVNLCQRGTVWNFVELSRDGGIAGDGGLAGAWLVWSAAWLGPRHHPRLRAALIVAAALLLIATALR
ncbi:MAG: hypothetical protein ACE5OS_08315 [Anaerolineae bacterium]